jgi:hypothetical protein
MDICFIKPQDLLPLSIAICAWCLDEVKRLSRSAILEEYSSHRQTAQGGDKTPESRASAGDGARLQLDNLPARTGWKAKEKQRKREEQLRSQTKRDISQKRIYLQKHKPSDYGSWATCD